MEIGKPFNPYRLFVGSFIPNCLMRTTSISPGAKLCWARLAQYAGKNGIAWPSQDTLAKELGVSTRQCRRYLAELEQEKFIKRQSPEGTDRLKHCSNRYVFLWHPCFQPGDDGADTGDIEAENAEKPVGDDLPGVVIYDLSEAGRYDRSGAGRYDRSNRRESSERESSERESQKESARANKESEFFTIPPDQQKWKDIALMVGLTEEEAEVSYDNFQANGWKRANKIPLESWDAVRGALKYWRNNRQRFPKPEKKETIAEKHARMKREGKL